MQRTIRRTAAGAAALAVCALGGTAVALGAGSGTAKTATTTTTATQPARTPETPLTGDALAKVKAAAIAKVGGTVDIATAENDSSNTAAAYEAHVTKADGTHVTVILDSSYAVLSVETGHGPGRPGGPMGFGGPGGFGRNGETELTGTVATQAKAAAVAKTGGTADFASTEKDNSNAAAAYEVHVTKADGTHVAVILDKDYNVLAVDTPPAGGPHGPGFGPDPGHDPGH